MTCLARSEPRDTAAAVAQRVGPRPGRLALAVGQGDEPFAPSARRPKITSSHGLSSFRSTSSWMPSPTHKRGRRYSARPSW
jgi:hypothetical protein